MTKSTRIEILLDSSLDQMFHEGQRAADCLRNEPSAPPELAPLLAMADSARSCVHEHSWDAARTRSQARIQAAIAEARLQDRSRQPYWRHLLAGLRPVTIWRAVAVGRRKPGTSLQPADQLDACLGSVLFNGLSVDEALERHEVRSDETRALLSLVLESRNAIDGYPDAAAIARSRQRIDLATRSAEARERTAARQGLPALSFLSRRLSYAVTAAAAVVAIGFVVFTSRTALPGDVLYPVKMVGEQAQAQLAISSQDKAEVAIRRTERRASELAALLERGDYIEAQSASDALAEQLDTVTRQIAGQQDGAARTAMQASLGQVAEVWLSNLDAAAIASGNRESAFVLVQNAAGAYASAVDTIMAGGTTTAMGESGQLEIRLASMSPPPAGYDGVHVRIGSLEVLRAGMGEDQWIPVLDESASIDLSSMDGAEISVAAAGLPAGTYSRLRVTIESVTLMSGVNSSPATLSSQTLTLSRPLTVKSGATVVSVLDFDNNQSITHSASGSLVYRPSVVLRSSQDPPTPVTSTRNGGDEPEATGEDSADLPGDTAETEAPGDEPAVSTLPGPPRRGIGREGDSPSRGNGHRQAGEPSANSKPQQTGEPAAGLPSASNGRGVGTSPEQLPADSNADSEAVSSEPVVSAPDDPAWEGDSVGPSNPGRGKTGQETTVSDATGSAGGPSKSEHPGNSSKTNDEAGNSTASTPHAQDEDRPQQGNSKSAGGPPGSSSDDSGPGKSDHQDSKQGSSNGSGVAESSQNQGPGKGEGQEPPADETRGNGAGNGSKNHDPGQSKGAGGEDDDAAEPDGQGKGADDSTHPQQGSHGGGSSDDPGDETLDSSGVGDESPNGQGERKNGRSRDKQTESSGSNDSAESPKSGHGSGVEQSPETPSSSTDSGRGGNKSQKPNSEPKPKGKPTGFA